MTHFPKLFEAGSIGKLKLKNKIIMSPMLCRYANDDGSVSDRFIDYYAERARGGCGLIMIEAAYPRPGGYPGRVCLYDDKFIAPLRKLADTVHAAGAKIGIQINPHRGRSDEVDPASASETVHHKTGARVRALSIEDIKELEEKMGDGARRAKEAGFDCIMIHGGSGYILSEFLSPRTNKRLDAYGGNVTRRARFALELVEAVKKSTGADYPVTFRMTADEKLDGGFGLEDAVVVAKLLEDAGIDAIDAVSGVAETYAWVIPYMYMPRGCNVSLSQTIKKAVRIPVSAPGRINDPDLAEEILRENKADFITLGRALVTDPYFPAKARTGQTDDICRCIACGRCNESILKPPVGPMICSVNPAVGREREFEARLKPAIKKKKVLVIGGGPAGMEAAMLAARRGHQVTLWEKGDKLGGLLNIAVVPPGKEEIRTFIEYLSNQLKKLKVDVHLGKQATAENISAFAPDAVVVAAGSRPLIPRIKGMEKKRTVTFRDVLSGKEKIGKRVAVIGGGFVGCETADFLAEKGKEVTVIEVLPELALEIFYPFADLLVKRLGESGVKTFSGVKDEVITEHGIDITDKEGKKISLVVDDVVMAVGSVADKSLFAALHGKISEIYEAGDSVKACRIHEAVRDGAEAGLRI